MDGRQELPSSYVGTAPYYAQPSGLVDPAMGFRHGLNEGSVLQLSGQMSAFPVDNFNSSYQHSTNIGSSSGTVQGELVKRRRGRPWKHGLDNSIPEPASNGSVGVSEKQKRGRPLGSGRKQKLASIGGWMNSSAGSAFAPIVLFISAGENVASKILQLACQRPRALCILSGSGTISSATVCQPPSSNVVFEHEGHFQILCLSGSYLVSESGTNKRTGGLNISLSGRDGLAFGGVVGNTLIADSPVQVIGFSFIYDCTKSMTKYEEPQPPILLKHEQEDGEPSNVANDRLNPSHNLTPTTAGNSWHSSQPSESRDPHSHTGTNLMLR